MLWFRIEELAYGVDSDARNDIMISLRASFRHLLHDRDGKFTAHGDALPGQVGSKVIRLPMCSPGLNDYAERWVRTVCLPEAIARARPLCFQTPVTSAPGTLRRPNHIPFSCPAWSTCGPRWPAFGTSLGPTLLVLGSGGSRR